LPLRFTGAAGAKLDGLDDLGKSDNGPWLTSRGGSGQNDNCSRRTLYCDLESPRLWNNLTFGNSRNNSPGHTAFCGGKPRGNKSEVKTSQHRPMDLTSERRDPVHRVTNGLILSALLLAEPLYRAAKSYSLAVELSQLRSHIPFTYDRPAEFVGNLQSSLVWSGLLCMCRLVPRTKRPQRRGGFQVLDRGCRGLHRNPVVGECMAFHMMGKDHRRSVGSNWSSSCYSSVYWQIGG
jgi:hypothetical protein